MCLDSFRRYNRKFYSGNFSYFCYWIFFFRKSKFFKYFQVDWNNLFNVFGYISFRAVGAALTALIISFLFGPKIIRTLQSRQIGETIRLDGPDSHLKKEGTPTMGGIIVLLAVILPTFLWAKVDDKHILLILLATMWMGIIGFLDDLYVLPEYRGQKIGEKLIEQLKQISINKKWNLVRLSLIHI